MIELLIALALVAVVGWFVTAPLRSPRDGDPAAATEDPRLADLEARKEALYRQIRDAELDHAQGKLSEEDWRRADAELRHDAIEVLKAIDGHEPAAAGDPEGDAATPGPPGG